MRVQPPVWSLLPAKNLSHRRLPIQLIVLHDTCGAGTHDDTIYLAKPGDGRQVSVDFTVEKDGSTWKLNPDPKIVATWHAGRATKWAEIENSDVNHASIGIEIVQAVGAIDYPDAQIRAVAHLCAWLCQEYKIPRENITTHQAISTDGSRSDPRKFRWADFSREFHAISGTAPSDQPTPAKQSGYSPHPDSIALLGGIVEKVRSATPILSKLAGLEHMCLVEGALFFQSDLDLDTDGEEEPGIRYEPTHQRGLSIGRGVNSNSTPYFVLPTGFGKEHGLRLGDVAAVIYRKRIEFAIYADNGPRQKIGEGSIALHRSLGFERIRHGRIIDAGISSGVITIAFPNSGMGIMQPIEKVRAIGRARFAAIGGIAL